MTDTGTITTTTITTSANPETQELELLKQRADILGIPYRSNTTLETLKTRINEAVAKGTKGTPGTDPDDASAPETAQQMRDRLQGEALVLVRCRIHNLHPEKRDLPGEIITVANRYIGTISKFIPFGEASENGYHIPKVIYDDLISRRFQHISLKKGTSGHDEVVRRMVPEYNVEVLPNLTVAELDELKLKQAAAERVGV